MIKFAITYFLIEYRGGGGGGRVCACVCVCARACVCGREKEKAYLKMCPRVPLLGVDKAGELERERDEQQSEIIEWCS